MNDDIVIYVRHEQRIIDEHYELAQKLVSLYDFIESNDKFTELPEEDKVLLTDQFQCMDCYLIILTKRVERYMQQ